MEAYIGEDGKLLPGIMKESKWNIVLFFLLTCIDCTCCIATWGLALYLVFWKSLFVIFCNAVFPNLVNSTSSPLVAACEKEEIEIIETLAKNVESEEHPAEEQSPQEEEAKQSDSELRVESPEASADSDKSSGSRPTSGFGERSDPEGEKSLGSDTPSSEDTNGQPSMPYITQGAGSVSLSAV